MKEQDFPPIDDLDYRLDDEEKITASVVSEEPDGSTSLVDLEYNFTHEKRTKWYP